MYILSKTINRNTILEWRDNYISYFDNIQDAKSFIDSHDDKYIAIAPVINKETFSLLFAKYKQDNIIIKSTEDDYLEIALSELNGYIPTKDNKEFLKLDSEYNNYNEEMKSINSVLEKRDQLLSKEEIVPTLNKLFIETVVDITKKDFEERNWEVPFEYKRDNDYIRELIVADFILKASAYYSKQEVAYYIEEELWT